MPNSLSLALIGCGKMGSALLRGWTQQPFIKNIDVVDPHLDDAVGHPKVTYYPGISKIGDGIMKADVVILAVKPQVMDKACEQIKPLISGKALILSIAAGQTIASFERRFGPDRAIIRAMPNTPAAIGKGITVLCANGLVSAAQQKNAERLLAASGAVEWVNDENLMDAVTALSGSGPAYVFLLIEILARAAQKQGLPADLAVKLARQTVIGSAALAEHEAKTPVETLRQNVTSPGGTTAAALKILMKGELQNLYDRALAAATKRGQELKS